MKMSEKEIDETLEKLVEEGKVEKFYSNGEWRYRYIPQKGEKIDCTDPPRPFKKEKKKVG